MYEFHELQSLSEGRDRLRPESLWTDEFIQRHHLHGFAYRRTGAERFYGPWKTQLTRNFIVKDSLTRLGVDFVREDVDVWLLKGFSLMGDIYHDWGERFASDVDLLVSVENLWRISDILRLHGFEKVQEKKWMGNRFKFLFNKTVSGVDICIEVHTQLFWHQEMNVFEGFRPASIDGFLVLSLEKQLAHLCGHLAFQHTYLKLFWLMDIFQFVKTYREKILWDRFWEFAIAGGLYKSCYISLQLCHRLGLAIEKELDEAPNKYRWTRTLLGKLVNFRFLYNPRKQRVRYFIVKNLVKDRLLLNVTYTVKWLLAKSKSAPNSYSKG